MLKNLAEKAIIPVALTVTGFVVVCCLLLYTFIQGDLMSDSIRHETAMADTLIKATRYTMLKEDRETLGQMVSDIGSQEGVEHVRIFNKKGLIMFSSDPGEIHRMVDKSAAGCVECHAGPTPIARLGPMDRVRQFANDRGRDVLAITAPIYNEPSCYTSGCHFHSPEDAVLGTLDIGVSQEPLKASLATLRNRMIVFCLMVLVLTIGGVGALLKRHVLTPVRQLVFYGDALSRGDLKAVPPRGAEEVEILAATLKEMAVRLEKNKADSTGRREE